MGGFLLPFLTLNSSLTGLIIAYFYIIRHCFIYICVIFIFLFKNKKAYIQAGAGIVYDSVPEKEFCETQNKAKAMINAIEEATAL